MQAHFLVIILNLVNYTANPMHADLMNRIGFKSSPLSVPILAQPHESIEASASRFASKRQWKSRCE